MLARGCRRRDNKPDGSPHRLSPLPGGQETFARTLAAHFFFGPVN